VDWAKKPGKLTTIKFVKDPRVPRDDIYKSSTVHVPEGLPPNSDSRPTPRSRPAASASSYGQPAYGQPSYGQPAYNQQKPAPTTGRQRRQPNQSAQGVQESRTPVQVPIPQALRAQPPPPPPPPMQPPAPAQPAQPIYRALYDFNGQTASELSFSKGEVLDITKKEGNGMQSLFLC
jgi:myosin I